MTHEPAAEREGHARLAEEQGALQRMATLVARSVSSAEVFAAVAHEVAQVMHVPSVALCRYDADGSAMTVIGAWSDRPHPFQPGTRWPLDGESMSARVLRTGRPARVENYENVPGTLATSAREYQLGRIAGAPIVVDGRVWGVMATSSPDGPLPDDVEDHLAQFTELVATVIATADSREVLRRLADEQAALRRVATLVARSAPPADLFEAVCVEVGRLFPADGAGLTRYESDGTVTTLFSAGGGEPVWTRAPLERGTAAGLVFETGRPGRIHSYEGVPGVTAAEARARGWRSVVAAPIIVEGRLWGVVGAASTSDEPLPADTEGRLAQFTELVATAISNSQARDDVRQLAEEQAALRRVATLVARGARPTKVFEAVCVEVGRLFPADGAGLARYESDGTATSIGRWTSTGGYEPMGTRSALERGTGSRLVFETGRPGRIHSYDGVPGVSAAYARARGWRSSVVAPIVVEGRLWGVVSASSTDEPLPVDSEGRLAQFTELVAAAIANAESRAELAASRSRIVATADATRRRIERDLHDGAQQRLVTLALELRGLQAGIPAELSKPREALSCVIDGLTGVLDDLRDMAHGIHPAILAEGGLGPALKMLGRRSAVPVKLNVRTDVPLPEHVQVTAYYVVAEALANSAKHAGASVAHIDAETRDRMLRVSVRDDGRGGADAARGSGLLGLKDRAEAIGGTMSLDSPHGGGTSLQVELPLDDHRD